MQARHILSTIALSIALSHASQGAITTVYDLVKDFAALNIPAAASPVAVTQNAGAVWTYQYENSPHNHDGTYTMLGLGWNANFRGYGLASFFSGTYMAGALVRAVVNPGEDPEGISPVLNPANANYLQSRARTGAGNLWEPLIIVWTAPEAGEVVVSITAQNASINDISPRTTNLSLDLWNGSALTILDSVSLARGNSYTLSASLAVQAGDQIHIWRDAFVDQQGLIAFSGTISLTVPEPASGLLLGLCGLLVLRRR